MTSSNIKNPCDRILYDYAMGFVGLPYRWGGDDTIDGFDCSGLVQEILASVGADPKGDQTAHGLYRHFVKNGFESIPEFGALAFYGLPSSVIHVAFCLDDYRCLEAGGGGSKTVSLSDAAAQNAYVRIRPIFRRQVILAVMMPHYSVRI